MQNIRCQVPAGGILAQHFAEVPSHLFYPGILLMKITWVQSQMARLLVLSEVAKKSGHTPAQLWYDSTQGYLWDCPMKEWFKEHFSIIANLFMATFTLTQEETCALHCLVCMRNMLAHAALSWYAMTEDRSAPVVIYVPRDDRNKHCRCCPDYPKPEDAAQGITLPFDEAALAGYLEYVDTVSAGLRRIAASMSLEYIDLQ